MDMQALIAAKRDGRKHTKSQLEWLGHAAGNGSIPDYQLSAWLMAAYLKGLTEDETAWLTLAMAASGEKLDRTGLPHPWIDKHSTGGVGDKTSMVVLPMLAACGLTVVKMSGRGLGITGGTVDKLQSIPGFRMDLSPEEMKAQAARIGIAISGQTSDLAPADKALYALRDVTATVSSIPLIVSSILSKKIASGAEICLLDVKCGSGAFMKSTNEAKTLARWLEEVGRRSGITCKAAITDMSQPLGHAIGNALEVEEAIRVLKGEQSRFSELCTRLCAEALEVCGIEPDRSRALSAAIESLKSGRAIAKAKAWLEAQGASAKVIDDPSLLPKAPVSKTVAHQGREAWIAKLDAETVGLTVIELGGGRHRKEDAIDPSVGIVSHIEVGHKVQADQPLYTVHATSDSAAETAIERMRTAIRFAPFEIDRPKLILAPS